MTRWARSDEGFCDAALLAEHLDVPDVGKKIDWTRTKPDGSSTRFSFTYPRNDRVPFLVTPYEPGQHPTGITHPNGATGLSRVHVDVGPADRAVEDDPAEFHRAATAAPPTAPGATGSSPPTTVSPCGRPTPPGSARSSSPG